MKWRIQNSRSTRQAKAAAQRLQAAVSDAEARGIDAFTRQSSKEGTFARQEYTFALVEQASAACNVCVRIPPHAFQAAKEERLRAAGPSPALRGEELRRELRWGGGGGGGDSSEKIAPLADMMEAVFQQEPWEHISLDRVEGSGLPCLDAWFE